MVNTDKFMPTPSKSVDLNSDSTIKTIQVKKRGRYWRDKQVAVLSDDELQETKDSFNNFSNSNVSSELDDTDTNAQIPQKREVKRKIEQKHFSEYQTYSSLRLQTALAKNADIVPYPLGTKVLVADQSRQLWPAKVIKVDGSKRLISYSGWGSVYDEWIDSDSERLQSSQESSVCQVVTMTQRDKVPVYSRTGAKLDRKALKGKHESLLQQNSLHSPVAKISKIDKKSFKRCKSTAPKKMDPEHLKKLAQQEMELTTFGFALNRKVNIRDSAGNYWPATMLKLEKGRILCRYNGWDQEFDEWIDSDSKRLCHLDDFEDSTAKKQEPFNSIDQSHVEIVSSRKFKKKADPNHPNTGKQIYTEKSLQKRRKRNALKLKDRCTLGAHVEIYGPNGWQRAIIVKATPFRIQVEYKFGWMTDMKEWVSINPDVIRFVCDDSDAEFFDDEEKRLSQQQERKLQEKREGDSATWIIYCDQCQSRIVHQRYFCTYCELPSPDKDGYEYESFELCLHCFQIGYRFHQHPRSSFAVQTIEDDLDMTQVIKDSFDIEYEERNLDTPVTDPHILLNYTDKRKLVTSSGKAGATSYGESLIPLPQKRICAFCNDESERLGPFIGPYPFLMPPQTEKDKNSNLKMIFWAHESCAKHSPEVIFIKGEWYNVAEAVRRGRHTKCHSCKEKGATIGCFEPKCVKSYHAGCTSKSMDAFNAGYIFWCPTHEAKYNRIDDYEDVYSCDGCHKALGIENELVLAKLGLQKEIESTSCWYSCQSCNSHFFTFDLCIECYSHKFPEEHEHDPSFFKKTSLEQRKAAKMKESEDMLNYMRQQKVIAAKLAFNKSKKQKPTGKRCEYCWTSLPITHNPKKEFNNILMCNDCVEMAPKSFKNSDSDETPLMPMDMKPFLNQYNTRGSNVEDTEHNSSILDTYGPTDEHLFSLFFDTSYYDCPGRAPRWCTHSGLDYHGTWLPQIVRMSLLRYTIKGDCVFTSFLGRGTDAIESFLLERKCCGVDINPSAVALSQKNVSFPLPESVVISAEYRPLLLLGDSRYLSGEIFKDETFDHILSHPPYKDCIIYSSDIDGDLSRIPNMEEFQNELSKVAAQSFRLLKWNKRVTVAIGDNRNNNYHLSVGFDTFRTYMNNGFQLEELILKRQRNCSASPLGAYLCTQYDFLQFSHEYVGILRKVDPSDHTLFPFVSQESGIEYKSTLRKIPNCPILRNSVVMGTTWSAKRSKNHTTQQFILAKIIERFGKDNHSWELIEFESFKSFVYSQLIYNDHCEERDSLEEVDEDDDDYETMRRNRISENKKQLIDLGLVSDLKSSEVIETGDYWDALMKLEVLSPSSKVNDNLFFVILPDLEITSTALTETSDWIMRYRNFILERAHESFDKLVTGGLFVIGLKDVRIISKSPSSGAILVPLGLLVTNDMNQGSLKFKFKIKDFVSFVPEGYQRDRNADIDELKERMEFDLNEWEQQRVEESKGNFDARRLLPIVHGYYLMYEKQSLS